MKILLISDIHANIEALTAIEENFDALLCMGDLVDYGPSPKECIAWLRLRVPVIVRGNHDNAVAYRQDCGCHGDFKALSVATRQLMWDLLDPEEIGFLQQLPLTKTLSWGELDSSFVMLLPPTPCSSICLQALLKTFGKRS
jgi:hypothetical protein